MTMTDGGSSPISHAADTRLDEQLRSGLRPTTDVSPDTEQMVRYLCGALPQDEARRLERILTAHSEQRQRQFSLLTQLDALQQMPWQEVESSAANGDPAARAWRSIVVERGQAKRLPRDRGASFWTAMGTGAGASIRMTLELILVP